MTRVLIDGRIAGHDGIGRYTTCLVRALRAQAGPGVTIDVLPPTGTPRYSRAEGTELLEAARACQADIVHLLDYRVPLEPATVPLVVTIHLPVLHVPTEDRKPVDGRYLLYVGQARAHKGMGILVDAYQRSHAAQARIRLVCVDRDFADKAPMSASIRNVLGNAAVMFGSVGDSTLCALYRHAEFLVHLAEHEGFGFTPLEALAAGTRVLTSDIPVLRETLADHALFTDPTDVAAIAKAINRLIATPDKPTSRRRRMSWAGRYRWSRHADDVLAIYREIAS
ncbi:MAG: glycosyltransferase [Pseudonocardiaceae bacterium]